MDEALFHPVIRDWFRERFGEPTEPQGLGWPAIAAGTPALIAAPTGSGKTLAAFLVCLDRLFRQWLEGGLEDAVQVVYVSPLKALSNDIRRNLEGPLQEIAERAELAGLGRPAIRTAVRTGDTPAAERQQMLRRPPHILVTTPESLFLLVTSEKSRERLRRVRTVIVDEIHALARDKRGSHLAVTLERLDRLCSQPPVRIGLSATQRPMERIADFLCGVRASGSPCRIVDAGHVRELDLALDVPPSELSAVCSSEQWAEVYEQLATHIESHRTTLVFVNTRRLAERVAHRLTERLGEEAVASHHGSLSRDLRWDAEQRLKAGKLKALVATASLEMGIDIGYVDLVCQVGSPRSIATFLQRVGRSGHSLRATPKGRLFPLTRDELLECLALVRAVRRGALDAIEIPDEPLDILAQQVIAAVACDEWDESELFALFRRSWPYRELARERFDAILKMVSEGLTPQIRQGAYIHRDQIGGKLRPRPGARIAALTSGGAIPEAPLYRVVTDPEGTFVGQVDEHFAVDSSAGDIFLLGSTSWQITAVRGQEVRVRDAHGAPPNVPFWFGESPGRSPELSEQLTEVRRELATRLQAPPAADEPRSNEALAAEWLRRDCGADDWAAAQAVRYVAAQVAATGVVPTMQEVIFERFFDESGGMQLAIHAPFGHRVNKAWGLALRKRFCRSFDFELQAAATDNGILLSIGPQHSFPLEQLFKMLGPHNGQEMLQQALFAVPVFPLRWRWNVSRALVVLRFQNGKKVPFFLQRFRADDLLAATFPATVGCLENHHGDIEIPDHPLVRQTVDDCLYEALDTRRWIQVLADYQRGAIQFLPRDTREPSPFSHELINANGYAFLDDADFEERRTRAVATRRTLAPEDFRDLSRLDPEAVRQVVADAAPVIRNADELHDAMLQAGLFVAVSDLRYAAWLEQLIDRGRAARVSIGPPASPSAGVPPSQALEMNEESAGTPMATNAVASGPREYWIAAERWPIIRAVYPGVVADPEPRLAEPLDKAWSASDGWVELARGRMLTAGPITASALADSLRLPPSQVFAALEALEGQGLVLRGQFVVEPNSGPANGGSTEPQWCDRRLLARIHRLTLEGLRRRIQPVSPADFVRFLARHQRWSGGYGAGPEGVRDAIAQLEGFELPAAAWERYVLAPRVAGYDPQWLDQLFLAGELTWGRLHPPKRDPREEASYAAMTRAMPLSLTRRDDLPWLLPPDRPAIDPADGAGAQAVLECLRRHGALFLPELRGLTKLAPDAVQEALRELASLGRITSDAFAAVRAIVARGESPLRVAAVGRWSLFPGLFLELAEPGDRTMTRAEHWCWLLLRRYGVVFRDLLARESAAPHWSELVVVYRRLELRGEIRGGRFVTGVAGEQFATEASVTQLRATRDEPVGDWIVISAADPLNLSGIVVPGPRIPATHRNLLVLRGGVCIAARRGGEIEFHAEDVDEHQRQAIRELLDSPRRRSWSLPPPHAAAFSSSASPAAVSATRPAEPSSPPSQGVAADPPAIPPPAASAGTKSRRIRDRWSSF